MDWQLGPFTRHDGAVIGPMPDLAWAAKDVFNPGGVVRDGAVHLLVRGEDHVGPFHGTSRLGLAVSTDGITFAVDPEPVLQPGDDQCAQWESGGGVEDPRVVETETGEYVCLYTGFDGRTARLLVATSPDMRTWTKHGLAFDGTPHAERWAKSGAIVTEVRDGRLVAAQVNGRYWMYWGEGICFAATSDDLIRWQPLEFAGNQDHYLDGDGVHHFDETAVLRPLLFPRQGRFDCRLVEPGPPAVRTDDGIVLIYNGADDRRTYQAGQALFDLEDPTACIGRTLTPFLKPETPEERSGQVDNVSFAETLLLFQGRWWLYFGMADSRIGCATATWPR